MPGRKEGQQQAACGSARAAQRSRVEDRVTTPPRRHLVDWAQHRQPTHRGVDDASAHKRQWKDESEGKAHRSAATATRDDYKFLPNKKPKHKWEVSGKGAFARSFRSSKTAALAADVASP